MARILGKAGRFASDEAARHRVHALIIGLVTIGILGFLEGVTVSTLWAKLNLAAWVNSSIQWACLLAILLVVRWSMRRIDELATSRAKWKRGASGETIVGKIIASFPDEFYVINDVSTPSGNLDHVVVGPTGVFVLDAKHWRGVVQPDGQGELLLNGERTDKPEIRRSLGRTMGVKEQIRSLAGGFNPYVRVLFAFTAARVDAAWGTTGKVHCLREDQLWDYIVESKRGQQLSAAEVERVAKAFQQIAKMEREFTEQAAEGEGKGMEKSENLKRDSKRKTGGHRPVASIPRPSVA